MKKTLTVLIVLLTLLLIIGVGAAWVLGNYHIIDGKLYSKDADYLDLRGEDITPSHYDALQETFPTSQIDWEVPFQGERYAPDIQELKITELSEADMELLSYFPQLETLDARESEDLSWLPALSKARPDLQVLFTLDLGGNSYPQDAAYIEAATVTDEALAVLPYMESLELVTLTEGADARTVELLGEFCKARNIPIQFSVAGQIVTSEVTQLTIPNITEAQAQLLMLMPQLESVHLPEPEAAPETLLALAETTSVTWEKTILGITFPGDATQIDLTDVIALGEGQTPGDKTAYEYGLEFEVMGTQEEHPSSAKILVEHPLPNKYEETIYMLEDIEAVMGYFPMAEELVMCGAYLDNESMAQFREDHREDYKVVWSVRCGSLLTRTDATSFMPTKYYVEGGIFNDMDEYNLRYCEELVCIDLGHMNISSVDFAQFMPNLKYLVITLTRVNNLSGLSSCKNLVFLEMDWCDYVEDFSPLLGCTALEDLNIGGTFADISPILEMSWLKNLWLVARDEESYHRARAALPDTNIGYFYSDPEDGWRNLPNYYAMRDELFMFYM